MLFCILHLLLLCHFPFLFKAPLIHIGAAIMSNWEGFWKEREGKKRNIEANEALAMTTAHACVCSCTSLTSPLLSIRRITCFPCSKSLPPDPTETAMFRCHKQETTLEVSLPQHLHPLLPWQLWGRARVCPGHSRVSMLSVKERKRVGANPATRDGGAKPRRIVQVKSTH